MRYLALALFFSVQTFTISSFAGTCTAYGCSSCGTCTAYGCPPCDGDDDTGATCTAYGCSSCGTCTAYGCPSCEVSAHMPILQPVIWASRVDQPAANETPK